jgi:hypothetical protein
VLFFFPFFVNKIQGRCLLETIFYGVKEGKKRFLFNLFSIEHKSIKKKKSTEQKLEREKYFPTVSDSTSWLYF